MTLLQILGDGFVILGVWIVSGMRAGGGANEAAIGIE
jgi:hypothetical protein